MSEASSSSELLLRTTLYSKSAISATCEVFEVCAAIEHVEEASYHRLQFAAKDGADVDEIIREFGNYVLGLTIEEHRSGQ